MMRTTGDGPSTAILTVYMLKKFICAEFTIFLFFLQLIIGLKVTQGQGNPFAQFVHDGATLANKKKYQAFGLQFVDPRWLCNLVVCIGFVFVLSSTNIDVANLIKKTMLERTGFPLLAVVALMVADGAAGGVSVAAGIKEKEICLMHDGDKIGSSATGKLIRSRRGEAVNAFQEGAAFMKRAHAMGVYFNYSTRHHDLMDLARTLKTVALIRIQVDLNDTRIAAEHGLLISEIRLSRALKMYQLAHPSAYVFSAEDWVVMVEFEAVLHMTQILTTLAQYEMKYMAAYGPAVTLMVYQMLTASTISLIDVDTISESPRLPRRDCPVDSLTPMGKTCLDRAIIEFERRFLDSELETRLETPGIIVINDRQLVATLLDVRTKTAPHLKPGQRAQAQRALGLLYTDFFVRSKAFDRARKSKAEAAAAEAATESSPSKRACLSPATPDKRSLDLKAPTSGAAADDTSGFDLGKDSDEEEVVVMPPKSEKDFAEEDKAAAEKEFPIVFRAWFNFAVDYRVEFPQEHFPDGPLVRVCVASCMFLA